MVQMMDEKSDVEDLLSWKETLSNLEKRVLKIEEKRKTKDKNCLMSSTITDDKAPPQATDPFSCRMLVSAIAAGFTNTRFVRCPSDYYDWPLEKRRALLDAPHVSHLTKSIVLENTRHNGKGDPTDVMTSRYLCCVVPYNTKIDSDRLRTAVRGMFAKKGLPTPGIKNFNYRLGENCIQVTGYEPNAVTPLGMKTPMPVVVAKEISQLNPPEFWLGGGEVSLKWKVLVSEFYAFCNPLVVDFTPKE